MRNEWNESVYPMVPGHEIVGRVVGVGASVKKFKMGDAAAVGVLVDSCRTCQSCRAGEEQYCETGAVGTYNGRDPQTGDITFGGYSNNIIADESFVFKVPLRTRPRRCRAAAVRRNYNLFAASALEGGPGTEGRGYRFGRTRAYGA